MANIANSLMWRFITEHPNWRGWGEDAATSAAPSIVIKYG